MKEKHIESFQSDANQDLWEDWASIMFAFDTKKSHQSKYLLAIRKYQYACMLIKILIFLYMKAWLGNSPTMHVTMD